MAMFCLMYSYDIFASVRLLYGLVSVGWEYWIFSLLGWKNLLGLMRKHMGINVFILGLYFVIK